MASQSNDDDFSNDFASGQDEIDFDLTNLVPHPDGDCTDEEIIAALVPEEPASRGPIKVTQAVTDGSNGLCAPDVERSNDDAGRLHRSNSKDERATFRRVLPSPRRAIPPTVTVVRAQKKGLFKLPTGKRIRSQHPVAEFDRNVRARWRMLSDENMLDDLWMADRWRDDALLRRRGIIKLEDRADCLGMDTAALAAFDAKVRDLEEDVWKKAADFYRGLLVCGIFDQTVLVHGGIYHEHQVWGWSEIQAKYGLSRATAFRRLRGTVTVTDLLRPARTKARTTYLEHDGQRYTARQFAAAFGVSRAQVREGMDQRTAPEQMMRAHSRRRGRPTSSPSIPRPSAAANASADTDNDCSA